LFAFSVQAQNDTLPYNLFKERLVLRSSLGYNTAPFSIRGKFGGEKEVLKYRANMNAVMGVGFSYKWMSLGLNFTLPGYIKNTDKFGETNYFDFNFNFGLKKWHFDFDIHNYTGFSLINASRFSDTLVEPGQSNQVKSKMQSASISMNAYHFKNKAFNMKAALGIVGNYKEEVKSFYMKYTMNLHGVSSPDGLIPYQYINDERSILQSTLMSAFDFGAVPGYVYVNNINGWQFGGFAGLGLVLQAKFYEFQNTTRGFLGLAPRLDLRLQGGYNIDNWFFMLDVSFDNKSIRFNDVIYRQNYYYIRLSYGYRFEKNK
jgi:hypothetical protein